MTETLHTYEKSNLAAKFNFSWIYPLLKVGTETCIQESHLPKLSHMDSSEYNRCIIERLWDQEVSSGRKNLARSLFYWYWKETWRAQILLLVNMASRLGQAIALGFLMEVFGKFTSLSDDALDEDADMDSKKGYLYASIMILCGMIAFPTKQHQFFETYRVGMRIRVGLVAAIFAKTLRLPSISSTGSGKKMTPGHLTNLASNDVERFLQTSVTITFLLHGPWIAIAILIIGIHSVGPIFSVGYGFLLLLVPIQIYLSKRFVTLRSQVASITDTRVSLLSQAITGARVMKMNGWEEEFYQRINKVRENETDKLLSASRLKAINEAIYYFSAPVISVLVFIIHVITGGTLSPKIVYTTLTLMSIVQFIITKHIPSAIMGLSECLVSCKRIQAFFELEEQKRDNIVMISGCNNGDPRDVDLIKLEKVSSRWDVQGYSETNTKETKEAISNVQLHFKPGTLYCIIGKVGSGKSALLHTITGELPISSGTLHTQNITMGYAPQDPWIMNGSIIENILMGNTLDSEWYRRVIDACCLAEDISRFQHGEDTIVGDRGVQLSGGQRGRIGLARALYVDADVLLLDDPLSAVDSKVALKMYHSAIHELAVKRGKCVILATHQHHFVGDSVCILMDQGVVRSSGSFRKSVEASNGDLSDVSQVQSCENLQHVFTDEEQSESLFFDTKNDKESEPFQSEKRQTGIITKSTWLQFGQELGGVPTYALFFALFASTQCCMLTTIVLVGVWSEKSPEQQFSSRWVVLMITLLASLVATSFLRAVFSFRVFVCTSKRLHDSVLRSVLRAKIEFFDTNPLGRIVNRFSADIGTADEIFPLTVYDFLVGVFVVLGSIVTIVIVLPFMILFLPPLIWFFLRLRKIFTQTSRELKRIEGLSRSPIFAILSESLNGIDTIRVNKKVEFFKNKFECAHNMHTRAYFAFVASSRWFAFHLDVLSFALMAAACIFAVVFHDQGWFSIDASILGLALTLLIQISTTNFPWIVRQSAEVSNQMVSIERLLEYKNLESEGPLKTDYDDIHPFWPQNPSVKVQSFTTRYRSNLPPVLSDVSFHIDQGTKVGVVGRTGSGKSSLVQSLFRILEAENGCIEIDNVDISKLGLHKLRHALSVIPQTPVLFGGYTIRENLDPFQKYSDDEIWSSLKDVQMSQTVHNIPDTLNAIVVDSGSNFSVGQRQLLCLARALLRKSKILILDEPTANVDMKTDSLVQKTLREKFQNATVISIAHRLETIINYDMIMVLGDGKVLEYASPSVLLSDINGHLTSMFKSRGQISENDRSHSA